MSDLNSKDKRASIFQVSISILTVVFAFLGSIFGGVISTHSSNEHNRKQDQFKRRSAAIEEMFTVPEGTDFKIAAENFLGANKYAIYTSRESSKRIASIIEERNKKNINCNSGVKFPDECLSFYAQLINVYRKDLGLEENELIILLTKSFNELNKQLIADFINIKYS